MRPTTRPRVRSARASLRIAVVFAAAAALVAAPIQVAQACSCAVGDPRDALAEADGAFVGELIHEGEVPSGRIISSAEEVTWTFRVEVSVKGDLGDEVDVQSPWDGSSCGFEVRQGQRVGVLLSEKADGWHGGLCTQIEPDSLLEAAAPLPEPRGTGPVTFLVAVSFGDMRLLALDANGETLAYGAGPGATYGLGVCPGSRAAVEAVHDEKEGIIAVRDLRSFQVVREVTVTDRGFPDLHAVACLDEGGRRILGIDGWGAGTTRIWLVDGEKRELLFEDRVRDVTLHGELALVVAPDGEVFTIDAQDRESRLGRVPTRVSNLALSPDGSMVAGTVYGGGVPGEPPTEVVLVRLPDGPVYRAALKGWNDDGDVAWVDDHRVAYLPGGADDDVARVFDTRLQQIDSFSDWYTSDAIVVGSTAFGIGWGELVSAELPHGPARVMQRFNSPETFAFAYVSDGDPIASTTAGNERSAVGGAGADDLGPALGLAVALVIGGSVAAVAAALTRRSRRTA